jgi:hypothetical protein
MEWMKRVEGKVQSMLCGSQSTSCAEEKREVGKGIGWPFCARKEPLGGDNYDTYTAPSTQERP